MIFSFELLLNLTIILFSVDELSVNEHCFLLYSLLIWLDCINFLLICLFYSILDLGMIQSIPQYNLKFLFYSYQVYFQAIFIFITNTLSKEGINALFITFYFRILIYLHSSTSSLKSSTWTK